MPLDALMRVAEVMNGDRDSVDNGRLGDSLVAFGGQVDDVKQIPEPRRKGVGDKGDSKSPNLAPKRSKKRESEIPEPVFQIPEPGEEINADALLSRERRLWNLETYGDRHGKRRVRRVLRFVSDPPTDVLGAITPELEAELKQRRGRWRHRTSREEAESLRPFAFAIAESHR